MDKRKNIVKNSEWLKLNMHPFKVACKVKDLQHHINAWAILKSAEDSHNKLDK
tara:strand:- start:2888 stop:3046 length:159 start_codon:yes stop_codon:yes gene_type:complete